MSPRRIRTSWPAAALLLALFVLGEVGRVAHFVFVPHELCATHGELAHVAPDRHEHGHAGCAAHAAQEGRSDGPEIVAAPAPEEHGDHCTVLLSTPKGRSGLQEPPPSFAPAAQSVAKIRPDHRRPGSGVPVFRIAPKQSPPFRG